MTLRWLALSALLLAEAMNLLDTTIVQVASPAIRAGLGASDAETQWLTAGYTFPFALLLITGGRLGDILGRRRAFALGVLGFVACSVLCAIAPGIPVLLAARIAQGGAAALLIPQTFGLIKAMFDGKELAAALGMIGPVMALAAVLGPVIGGLLADADLFGTGWRAVFLVNLPLGVLVLAATPLITEDRAPGKPRLDLLGTLLAALAAGLLIYPLIEGNDAGWPLWTWLSMTLGLAVLVLFVRQQRRATRPLVERGLFTGRVFPAALAGSLLFFAVDNGLMFVLVLYRQLGTGATAAHTGIAMLPWSVGLGLGSIVTARALLPRFGPRAMRAGPLVVVLGLIATAPTLNPWPLLICGAGLGMFTVPFFGNALSTVDHQQAGSASGLLNAVQQLGATVGVALFGALLFGHAPATGARLAFLLASALLGGVLALTYPMLMRSSTATTRRRSAHPATRRRAARPRPTSAGTGTSR